MVAATLAIGMLAAVHPAPAEAATVDTNAWYVLVNRNSGKALDVSDASTADGARVSQWTRHDGANQQWQFLDSGGGFYRLKARHSDKVPDVAGASTADGAAIQQWADHNGANQQFRLADSDAGHVRLVSRTSDKALEVQGASTTDGGNVVQRARRRARAYPPRAGLVEAAPFGCAGVTAFNAVRKAGTGC